MGRPGLDPELKQKIKTLTLAGKGQKEIAATLAIHRNRVYRYQKAMGLHAWWSSIPTAAKEKKILGLLREGVRRKRVEKLTRSTVYAVRRIAEAHGIGGRKQLSENLQVVYDIVHRNGSATAIAKRYSVSYKRVLKLAHKLLQCPTFDSCLPQKWPEPEMFIAARESVTTGEGAADQECFEECLRIVDRIVFEYGNGNMPADRAALVGLIVSKFAVPENIPPDMRSRLSLGEFERARADFAVNLTAALDIFARDRDAEYTN